METVRLGRTGIIVSKNGFGALPIQRVSTEEAAYLLSIQHNTALSTGPFSTTRRIRMQSCRDHCL